MFFTKSVTDITLFQYVKRFKAKNAKFLLPHRQLRKSKSDISIALKIKTKVFCKTFEISKLIK